MKVGALRAYVQRKYGDAGFDRNGHIKMSVLKEVKKNGNAVTRRRATFAINSR